MEAGAKFLLNLYGCKKEKNLNSARVKIFSSKREPPKLRNLPPTDIAATEHIKRARHQVLIWLAALRDDPPAIDATKFGWKMVEGKYHV